jgi:DinB superfamily
MGMEAPEAQRIRGYLVAQAARLTVPEMVDKLRRDVLPLRTAAGRVPAGRFHERPADGEWSAAEVFTHVLEMTEHGDAAIAAIIAGGRPMTVRDAISGNVAEGLAGAEDYWRAFEALREPFYARVLRARGDEHLDVTISHPWFGPLSWREWLLFMRVHDLDHMRQIEAIAERFGA